MYNNAALIGGRGFYNSATLRGGAIRRTKHAALGRLTGGWKQDYLSIGREAGDRPLLYICDASGTPRMDLLQALGDAIYQNDFSRTESEYMRRRLNSYLRLDRRLTKAANIGAAYLLDNALLKIRQAQLRMRATYDKSAKRQLSKEVKEMKLSYDRLLRTLQGFDNVDLNLVTLIQKSLRRKRSGTGRVSRTPATIAYQALGEEDRGYAADPMMRTLNVRKRAFYN